MANLLFIGFAPRPMLCNAGPMQSVAEFDNVGLRYGTGAETLTDVSFTLFPGSFYFLTGASGAGKTSLLKLLYLAHRPSRGAISTVSCGSRWKRSPSLRPGSCSHRSAVAGTVTISCTVALTLWRPRCATAGDATTQSVVPSATRTRTPAPSRRRPRAWFQLCLRRPDELR